MKNWVYFIAIAVLVAEIFKILICAGTTYRDNGHDVTIATHSLPDLYLLKMKTALFVSPESNGLSYVCAV